MGSKDHEKVSAEDFELLESLLVSYYAKPYPESYQLLRKRIEARFRGKDTNSKYVSILMADLNDLVLTVIFRLASINGKSIRRKAEKINDLELMANKITDFVYKEELRVIRQRLREQPIEDNDSDGTVQPMLRQAVDGEIQTIKTEIIQRCYDACVETLPAHIKPVFRAYYPNVRLESAELVAVRKRLANEQARLTQAQAQDQTEEEENRTLNNLQSKVNKWRKSHIEECVEKCFAAQESQHSRLNYLRQQ